MKSHSILLTLFLSLVNSENIGVFPVTESIDGDGLDILKTLHYNDYVFSSFRNFLGAVTPEVFSTISEPNGPFTLFASAFDPFDNVESLLSPFCRDFLSDILLFHVVPGKFLKSDLTDGMMLPTLHGESLRVDVDDDGQVMINGISLFYNDIPASNGVVHGLNNALLLPDGLSPKSIEFACSEEIFKMDNYIIEDQADYDILNTEESIGLGCSICGEGRTAGNEDAILKLPGKAGVTCGVFQEDGQNGTIPQSQCNFLPALVNDICECRSTTPIPTAALVDFPNEDDNELDILRKLYDSDALFLSFRNFLGAFTPEALVGISEPNGPFTLLAPVEAPFRDIIECLLLPDNIDFLTSILLLHVIPGKFLYSDLSNSMTLSTLNGETLKVNVVEGVGGGIKINGIFISYRDISASNGVVQGLSYGEFLLPAGYDLDTIKAICDAGGGFSIVAPSDPPEKYTGSFCFSGDSMVHVKDKEMVKMADLALGDMVMVGDNKFESIYSFGHKNDSVSTKYIQITTDATKKPLEISGAHMVIIQGERSVPASTIKKGDKLQTATIDNLATVINVEIITRKGAYAPFTNSGKIIVNNIVASNYISYQGSEYLKIKNMETPLSYQWIAHTFNSVHRLAVMMGFKSETYTESGVSHWVNMPHNIFFWMLEQNIFIASTLIFASLFFFGLTSLLEILVLNSFIIILIITSTIIIQKKSMKKGEMVNVWNRLGYRGK